MQHESFRDFITRLGFTESTTLTGNTLWEYRRHAGGELDLSVKYGSESGLTGKLWFVYTRQPKPYYRLLTQEPNRDEISRLVSEVK